MKRPALTLTLLLAALAALAHPRPARAQSDGEPAANAAAPGTLPAELDALGRWFAARQQPTACTDRCYVLDRLALTGAVGAGDDGATRLSFELTGAVLARGAVAVPLFGPPGHVRIEGATLDGGRPASIGFEGDHYYLYTDARRFTLRGTIALRDELALAIPGPLNALEADLSRGAVVEGAHLSGLADTTIHFDAGAGAAGVDDASPAVFQLARAVRVAREVTFEYRLTLRSGRELGVVRVPLAFGERVLDVQGSAPGWHVEGTDLVVPTAGREANVTVTGTLPSLGAAFAPDARSTYEWWLFESDPEHRISVTTEGRQHDASESPIARTQPNARLYLVGRGQHAELAVQSLVSADVLAAVVRQHARMVVLTARGDLVSDDELAYDNNGIDYLMYTPAGRPIYLGTDGAAERIMHRDRDPSTVMIPLRSGAHTARVQALGTATTRLLGGRLELPAPSYPLAAGRATVTLGLPAAVHPLLATGGDCTHAFFGTDDALALLLAVGAAWLALRGRGRRLLGAVVLGGLWFVAPGAYVAAMGALVGAGFVWLASRFLRGPPLVATAFVLLAGTGLASLIGMAALATREAPHAPALFGAAATDQTVVADGSRREATSERWRANPSADYGSFNAQNAVATGGVIQGVTPVAITLPGYARAVTFSRELVTRQRPFRPVVYYVTDAGLAPLVAAWLLCLAALVVVHRRELRALRTRVAERLARRPDDDASAPAPAAP